MGVLGQYRSFPRPVQLLLINQLTINVGYKPLIVTGCALRTVGFGLLGVVDAVPALVVASIATGFAGALFNPAVRAYLAHDAGERRVEAFARFNMFYQAGILLGPLIGLAPTDVTFTLACAVAAAVLALLTVLRIRALPQRTGAADTAREPLLSTWRTTRTRPSPPNRWRAPPSWPCSPSRAW